MIQKIGPGADYTESKLVYRPGSGAPVADSLEATVVAKDAALASIDANRDLTPKAKAQRKRQVVEATVERLKAIDAKDIGSLRASRDRAERLLSPEQRHRLPDGTSPEESRQIEAEIRAQFAGMKPEDRVDAYYRACRADDRLTIRALEKAPSSMGLLPAEAITEGAELHAQSAWPDKYQDLAERRFVVQSLRADLKRLLRELGEEYAAPSVEELVGLTG